MIYYVILLSFATFATNGADMFFFLWGVEGVCNEIVRQHVAGTSGGLICFSVLYSYLLGDNCRSYRKFGGQMNSVQINSYLNLKKHKANLSF